MNMLYLHKDFYDYDFFIEREFRNRGVNIYSMNIDAPLNYLDKIKSKETLKKINYDYQLSTVKKMPDNSFDVVFVLSGQGLEAETIEYLRRHNKALFVWYIWDSVQNLKDFNKNKDLFDVIISFDKLEAKKMNMKYNPLFYIYKDSNYSSIKYEISTIGHDRTYRREIIKKIIEYNDLKDCYIFLHTSKKEIVKSFFAEDIKFYKYLKNNKLHYKNMIDILNKSKIILDIPAPNQTGITMRTIEALGCKKKIITTNIEVTNYDFYNPNNIFVLNMHDYRIPDSFRYRDYEEIDSTIYSYYHISEWCLRNLEIIKGIDRYR